LEQKKEDFMNERELRGVLSANIKRYRARIGLSQLALALKLEISTNFLSDIETGKKWVSPTTLVKLAGVLNVGVYELFKPQEVLPQDRAAIITKYTEDAVLLVKQSLNNLRDIYLSESE
jgi:transcriptional regulator with XRE-family HTH domain